VAKENTASAAPERFFFEDSDVSSFYYS